MATLSQVHHRARQLRSVSRLEERLLHLSVVAISLVVVFTRLA